MTALIEHSWALWLGILGFALLWPLSLVRRDASIVDFWWGPGIGVMAFALWGAVGAPTNVATLALLIPIVIWSARLGIQLGLRRITEGVEDPRYVSLRDRFSPGWWWKSFFIIFMLQGFLQVFVGLGVFAALATAPDTNNSILAVALSGISLIAIVVQTVSDTQLDIFRRRVPHRGLLTSGLRQFVRYPSYSAEIVFWTCLTGVAVLYGIWWAPVSALLITGLLRYVSGVAILEDRLAQTRPDFVAYQESVPALVPNILNPRPARQKTADERLG